MVPYITGESEMRTGSRKRNSCRGQALVEYAAMVGMTLAILIIMLLLLEAFSAYGSRLISFIAWEPSPASYDAMSAFGKNN